MGKEEQSSTQKDAKSAENGTNSGDKKSEESKQGGAPLTDQDIALFKRYGKGPYTDAIRKAEEDIKQFNQKITALCGIKESDTGLALPS